jgi:hypothetical protein
MILNPFKVHSPDGKSFYEGEAPQAAPVPQEGETLTRYVVIGYGETDNPQGAFIQTPEELLDAVLGMIYMHPSDAPADIREAYQKDLADEDEWQGGIWRTEFEIGGIVIYDIGAPLASNKAAAVAVTRQDSVTLTGAQLLEALDFIAPDRATDADQLEGDVTLQRGDGYSGRGLYCWLSEYPDEGATLLSDEISPAPIASASEAVPVASLTVWYGSMPESNGKTNWTAILHKGDIASGMTIDRSEYPERVRYVADRVRWLIGELDKEPFILDYDADKHSGYTHPAAAQPLRAEVLEILSELAVLKRYHQSTNPNCKTVRSSMVNIPHELLDRIDDALKDRP